MDLSRPFRVITPTLDGDVLGVLAGTTSPLTGREIVRLLGLSSHEGVRRVLLRLVEQGIVSRHRAGQAFQFRLNREHLAAPYVEGIAALHSRLVAQLRSHIDAWRTPPTLAVLFGSAARRDAAVTSDLDLLVVRPRDVDPDDETWRDQLGRLEQDSTGWTGNDARVLEFGEEEIADAAAEPLLRSAAAEGIELHGSLDTLRRATRRRARP